MEGMWKAALTPRKTISVSIFVLAVVNSLFLVQFWDVRKALSDGISRTLAVLPFRNTPVIRRPLFSFENNTLESVFPTKKDNLVAMQFLSNVTKLLIDDYVAWHRRTLDDINFGKLDPKKVRVLVHWSDKGIGDRFRGMLNAYLMAVLSQRLFLVKWEEPFPLAKVLSIGTRTNFTYDASVFGGADVKIPTKDFKSHVVAYERFVNDTPKLMFVCNWDLNSIRLFMVNIPEKYPELPMSKKVKELGNGRFGLQHRDWMFELLFQEFFKPTDEFVKHVEKYLYQVLPVHGKGEFGINQLKPYVAAHIRLGNGTKELNYYRFRHHLSPKEAAQCLSRTLMEQANKIEGRPRRFFLATDAVKLRSELEKELKKADSNSVVLYGDWDVKHVKHMSATESDLDIYYNTFLEIYMLSHCDRMVASNSAFNDLAAWWGSGIRKTRWDIEKCTEYTSKLKK